ncbi:MAG: hypothetical protein LBG06_02945 [Deltaproteobacteria bacterium]|nr:hypothetical protein [Deltaproteobacteria bacterium]
MKHAPKRTLSNALKLLLHPSAPLWGELFAADKGGGMLRGKPRGFVLADPGLNLWQGIRDDAILYFNGAGKGSAAAGWPRPGPGKGDGGSGRPPAIHFWHAPGEALLRARVAGLDCLLPSGHVLSSQVSCINHLFPLVSDGQAAGAVLRALSRDWDDPIDEALPVDIHERGNYVEFEVVGGGSYLNEAGPSGLLTRGARCTSLDAVMKGRTRGGGTALFLIEWKYVERYREKPKWDGESESVRRARYHALLTADDAPFDFSGTGRDARLLSRLFTNPYYELMRQTLLGHRMTRDPGSNGGATSFRHAVIVPDANRWLLASSGPLAGAGGDLAGNWNAIAKTPAVFIDPERMLEPASSLDPDRHAGWISYLRKRYWDPCRSAAQ